jgi:G6PDH family F420-dependent oxidoreductase
MRIHPAIIAQAAATAADMMPGRFFLGIGSGENLNEHILGDKWPPPPIRLEMLEEAVEIIRLLWGGDEESFYGNYYTVEDARLYTLPKELPPIYIASSGEVSASLAGRIGDGLISGTLDQEIIKGFEDAGGKGKPRYAKVDVCIADTEAQGRKIAHKIWKNTALKGQLNVELATPSLFEAASVNVSEDDVAEGVLSTLDPQKHLEQIYKYRDAGYDHVYVHQIGPDQEKFFQYYEKHILKELS